MKIGLVARCEDRGLGVMTAAFHWWMRPDKTLLIRPTPRLARGFRQYPERFPDATVLDWDGGLLPEADCRAFLEGLDVVYSAETWYDQRLVEWAREAGVATVLHVMPELWNADWPRPTRLWLPTTWRAELMPEHDVVPVPVEPPAETVDLNTDGPLRVLHMAGHRAMADRNGTLTFLMALRNVRASVAATMLCQDRRGPRAQGVPARVRYRAVLGPQESVAPHLLAHDVLVMPRRYGGLCLPVQEALAHGLAVVMPNCVPNADWPLLAVRTEDDGVERSITTAAGTIPLANVRPQDLATAIDTLSEDRSLLAVLQAQARKWATQHAWPHMVEHYRAKLAEAA